MGLFNFGSYDKPGPGVSKDEPPKAAPIRFFQLYFRKFSKLTQLNLIFLMPVVAVAALMVALYVFPTHYAMQVPFGEANIQLDVWSFYVVPLPTILLSPFWAGMTIVTRNFAREEHAFVWSDFWEAVKNNWKYFLLNGVVVYLVYFVLSFSMIYYYNSAALNSFYYVPFWICVVVAVLFLFAQYYIPVMFVTFDLKFGQVYRNALIFILAGFGRNLLLTLILGVLIFVLIGVIPIMPLTVTLLLLFFAFVAFSLAAFLINFTIYPVIDQYLIQPYNRKVEEEKNGKPKEIEGDAEPDPIREEFSEIFQPEPQEDEEEEDGEEKYVFLNGKLVKRSELKPEEREQLDDQ